MTRARRTCGGKIINPDNPDDRRNCPALADGSDNLCAKHRKEYEQRRGTTTERGYGSEHQKIRKWLIFQLKLIPPQDRICELCGEIMLMSEELHADHVTRLVDDPSAKAGRMTHRACNEGRSKAGTFREIP